MLPKFSVKKPMTVVVAIILIIVLGCISYANTGVDMLPEMELPYVMVMTGSPGASPEEVEARITAPLESTLGLLGGLKNMISSSAEGVSTLLMEFEQEADMASIMVEMSSLVDAAAAAFPDSAASPIFLRLNPSMMPVLILTADKDDTQPAEFSAYVEDKLLPALQRVEGVANVEAIGLVSRQAELIWNDSAIEDYNDRILREIDRQLAEAKAELDDAKAELEDGRAELDEETDELYDELSEISNELIDGRIQLEMGQAQLDAAPEQLKAQKKQLKSSRDSILQLLDMYDALEQLEAGIAQLEPALEQMNATERAIVDSFGSVDAARRAISEQQEALDTAYADYNAALAGGDPSAIGSAALALQQEMLASGALLAQIAEITGAGEGGGMPEELPADPAQAYLLLSAGMTQADAGLAAFISGKAEAEATYAELTAQAAMLGNAAMGQMSREEAEEYLEQIEDGIDEINEALAELPEAQQELDEAREELNEGSIELERGKLEASTQLSAAGVQLALAETQLDAAYDEFYEARDDAFKNAGLEGALTPDLLAGILGAEHFSMPAGYLTDADTEILLKVGDKFISLEELNDLILMDIDAADIGAIKVSDVTSLEMSDNAAISYAMVNGNPGLILSVQKQSLSSTAGVSKQLNAAIEELMAETPGLHLTSMYDQGFFIRVALSAVVNNLLLGAALAIIMLILFLRSWRPTLIIAVSIPISLFAALTLMYFTGVSINVVSLAGLAMGVGMLVDNSIVVIENIYRMRAEGSSAKEAAIAGARQVTGAIAASTLTTVCVFLPVLFTHGITRQLFSDMGLTVAYSLLASLLVALTLIPAAGANILRRPPRPAPLFDKLTAFYLRLLKINLTRKWPVFLLCLAVLAGCAVGLVSVGTGFMPSVDYGQLSATMTADDADLSQEQKQDLADQVLERIMEPEYVAMAAAYDGAGFISGFMGDEGDISFYITLDPEARKPAAEAAAEFQELIADLPVTLSVETSAADLSALVGSGVQVLVRGEDLDTLNAAAQEVAAIVSGVEGFIEVDDGRGDTVPELRVIVDKNKAMRYGLTVAQIYSELAGKVSDSQQAIVIDTADGEYPVLISRDPASRLDRARLADYEFTVTRPSLDGGEAEEETVYLSQIATIRQTDGLAAINRVDQVRYLQVNAQVAEGYNIGLISRELEAALAEYQPPAGVTVEISGENESTQEILGDALLMVLLACVFIYLIMVAQFQNLLLPFIVLLTIPLAFSGGLSCLLLLGQEITVVAMLGFLLLAGIIVNNGIVLIDRVNQLRAEGLERREALVEAGRQRLRPIMMTALTTICSLLALVFSQQMGSELLRPMAIVAAAGMVYATVLTLFLVPSLYELFTRK